MKKLLPIILLLSMLNLSCEKEEVCQSLQICDLASSIILPALGVPIGESFGLFNTVLNLAGDLLECTEQAPPSESLFDIEYREDSGSEWIVVEEASGEVIEIGNILAGGEDKKEMMYKFNTPGQYRFKTDADYNTRVQERNENNNAAQAGGRIASGNPNGSNNIFISEILTVTNPNNLDVNLEGPKLELIEIRDLK